MQLFLKKNADFAIQEIHVYLHMEGLIINAFIKPIKVISTYRKVYIGKRII